MTRSFAYKPFSWFFLFLLSCTVLFADFFSKRATEQYFQGAFHSKSIMVIPDFFGITVRLVYETNTGAAWGFFADFPQLLLIFRIALVTLLLSYLIFFTSSRPFSIPLVLIISGAIGNIADYFLYGHVIDMIHCIFWGYNYPVFNLADTAIFIGTCWIVFSSLFDSKKVSS